MSYVHAPVLKRRLNLNVAANLLSRQHQSAHGEVVGCYGSRHNNLENSYEKREEMQSELIEKQV